MILNTDILLIGGGISGLLTARELCLAGLKVLIIDKSATGQESSWAGGGILLPIYPWRLPSAISALAIASIQRYPELQQQLFHATGIDPEWQACGMLICNNPDIEVAITWCQRYQIAYQSVAQSDFKDLQCQFQHPLYLPTIAQVRNPRLLQSLKAFLQQKGVVFIENTEINSVAIDKQRFHSLEITGYTINFNELIVCAGAWTPKVLQQLLPDAVNRQHLPIQPVKGQMLLFAALPNTLKTMVLEGDHYLIPRKDGKILAGSTVEYTQFDKATTEVAGTQLYQFAINLLPKLQQYPVIKHWAGLRPDSPDGVPFIGRYPGFANLTVNAGHFRNGLVMGPASAQLLADILLDRPMSINPEPYALKF